MTIKQIKEKYPFHHIFVNGCELYHKDNSVDEREVKSIASKKWLFDSDAVMVEV